MRPVLRLFRDTYRGLPASCWLLSMVAFVNRAGTMVVPYFTIYLKQEFGLSVSEAGAFLGVYGIGSVLGNVLGGRLADRIGAVQLQVASLLLAGAWFAVLTQASTLAWLGAGMFVLGLLNDMFRPGNMAAVTHAAPVEVRAKALALNRLMINAGWAVGPTIGGELAGIGYDLLFLVDGATCMAAGLLLLALRSHIRQLPHAGGATSAEDPACSPWRDGRLLVLLALSTGITMVFMQMYSSGMRHMKDTLGWREDEIGWLLAVNPVLIALVEMPLVHVLRRHAPLPIVALGSAMVGLSLCMFEVAPTTAGLVAMMMCFTLGEMLWSPLLGAHVSSIAPDRARGSYLGLYSSTFALAWIVAPFSGGTVYDVLGPAALWYGCCAAGLALGAGFLLLHRAQRKATSSATLPAS